MPSSFALRSDHKLFVLLVCVAVLSGCGETKADETPDRGGSARGVDAAPDEPAGASDDDVNAGQGGASTGVSPDGGGEGDGGPSAGGASPAVVPSVPATQPVPTAPVPSGVGGSTALPEPNIVPGAWRCTVNAFRDGTCDCGCGAPDPDCPSEDIDACERCDATESCGWGACPASIDPEDTTTCREIPEGWGCTEADYFDEECDCGCDIRDPACEDRDLASCDTCNPLGGCSDGSCPGAIDPDDNRTCFVPEGWSCYPRDYGDDSCHCGCGVLDIDCASLSVDACEICVSGCANELCPGPIDAADNTICTGVPNTWNCDERFFADGSLCHCGCGAIDPDCGDGGIEACERCDFEGSCSPLECPGSIDPENTARCITLNPPEGWTCSTFQYADGYCDCGCGALDIDCSDASIESCEACGNCGTGCPGRVDPLDPTQCLPVPEDWTCDSFTYADGYSCECGCGVVDPDCADATSASCQYCPAYSGSCSTSYCEDIVPEDNSRCLGDAPVEWLCDLTTYGDQACDCGCGSVDIDCASATSECDLCNADGSCADGDCNVVDPANNAACLP